MDHPIVHIEISSTDLTKAQKFYSQLFNWKITAWGGSSDYLMFETGKEPGGGIQKVDKVRPGDGVLIYVMVEDIEKTLSKAKELGGKIVKEKTEIPNVGWFGLLTDLDGNTIGVFKAKM
jgi:predicted enzyme related to lactoylglutathione lyase